MRSFSWSALVATTLAAVPCFASTGVVDANGQYPAVGAYYEFAVDPDGTVEWAEESCTATLVSSRLAITAAHCSAFFLEDAGITGYADRAWVTFSTIASKNDFHCFLRQNGFATGVSGPADNSADDQLPCNPVENDPGIPPHPRPTFYPVAPTGFVGGKPVTIGITHPGYLEERPRPDGTYRRRVNNLGNLPDLAFVYLATPVTTIAPMSIAPAGYLDGIANLTTVAATDVGYGLNWLKAPGTPSGPQQVSAGSGVRRIASLGTIQTLHAQSVVPSQNPNRGDDTVCFGDSGSPLFLDANRDGQPDPLITGILSGWTNWCQGSHDPYSRIDTPIARSFLSCVLGATSLAAARACGAESKISGLCANATCN